MKQTCSFLFRRLERRRKTKRKEETRKIWKLLTLSTTTCPENVRALLICIIIFNLCASVQFYVFTVLFSFRCFRCVFLLISIYRWNFSVDFGKKHPDPIVETASMASVEPPDVKYKLKMPKSVAESGVLSALQLESIVYACQKHESFLGDGSRAGFLIGSFSVPLIFGTKSFYSCKK